MPLKIICKKKNKHEGILLYNEKKIKCIFGFSGIGIKLREGDGVTPTGLYSFQNIYYRPDRVTSIKTNIESKKILQCSGWSTDSSDSNYNKFIIKPYRFIHENLYRRDGSYDLILALNYNYPNPKKRKGSAIFLHCSEKNKAYTEGCIAIEKVHLIELIKIITRSSRLLIK